MVSILQSPNRILIFLRQTDLASVIFVVFIIYIYIAYRYGRELDNMVKYYNHIEEHAQKLVDDAVREL